MRDLIILTKALLFVGTRGSRSPDKFSSWLGPPSFGSASTAIGRTTAVTSPRSRRKGTIQRNRRDSIIPSPERKRLKLKPELPAPQQISGMESVNTRFTERGGLARARAGFSL